jgi:hypothetical protein
LCVLKTTKSGIKFDEIQAAMGLRSHVSGAIAEIDSDEIIDNERPGASPCDLLLVIVRVYYRCVLKNIDDIFIFACH